jgi:hypothetical protein
LEQKSLEGSNNKGEEVQKKKPSNDKVLVVDDEEPLRKLARKSVYNGKQWY